MTNIAFIGRLRSGKSSAAQYLVEHYGYERRSFATPVKELSAAMLRTAGEFMVNHGNDNGELTLDMSARTFDRMKNENQIMRKMAQFVGTELGREFFGPEDVWIQMLLRSMPENAPAVVDDTRFLNELDALKANGFVIVRVIREDDAWLGHMRESFSHDQIHAMLAHPSEAQIAEYEADYTLHAGEGITVLHDQLDQLMMRLRLDKRVENSVY